MRASLRIANSTESYADLDLAVHVVQLLPHRLREGSDGVLGGRIDAPAGHIGHVVARDAAHVHHVPVDLVLEHVLDRLAGADAQPQHVHVDGVPPALRVPRREGGRDQDTRVVDQHVDRAHVLLDPFEAFDRFLLVPQVNLQGEIIILLVELLAVLFEDVELGAQGGDLQKLRLFQEVLRVGGRPSSRRG